MTEARPVLRTSPSGPRKSIVGGMLQVGYDAPIEAITAPNGTDAYFPRDAGGNPLEVTFPDFTLGNILEVEYQLSGFFQSEDPGPFAIQTTPAVSVDGGTTFYFLYPGNSLVEVEHAATGFSVDGIAAVKIEDPMPILVTGNPSTVPVTAPPIVRLFYTCPEDEIDVRNSSAVHGGGACLKASEISADYVFQGPGGVLATT